AKRFFDEAGFWSNRHGYPDLVAAIESVPEQVTVMSDAMDFIDREVERQDLARREKEILADIASVRTLLKIPLYDFQARGAVFLDLDLMNAWRPDVVVLDEAQRIKNWESKTSRAVKKLRSRYAIVLTGTPLENKLEELYSIVQFVDDRRLGPAFEFLHEHRVLDAKGNLVGYRNLDKIRERLAPILLRRT